MGTIASVLQWNCINCNLINPTESLKCRCGTVRQINTKTTRTTTIGTATKSRQQQAQLQHQQSSSSSHSSSRAQSPENSSQQYKQQQQQAVLKISGSNNSIKLETGVFIQENGDTIVDRNQCKRVYKSLLRGCLKRPQRNQQQLLAPCVDCEDTRKYVKNSIELFHHFSNPSLNRRWICSACDCDNNSVTWHCVICDCVSYLAPIYKEQQKQQITNEHVHDYGSTLNVEQAINSKIDSDANKQRLHSYQLRRAQSLTTDKSFSGRSCHICYVNKSKDIFNLPQAFMHKYNRNNGEADDNLCGEEANNFLFLCHYTLFM